jgi:hypothetical protein
MTERSYKKEGGKEGRKGVNLQNNRLSLPNKEVTLVTEIE